MHNKGEFIHKLQANTGVKDRAEAEAILETVLGTLRARLTQEEAAHVEAQLPEDMKPVWRGGHMQAAAMQKLSYSQFMDKIAQETHLDRDGAEEMTKAVFHLLKEQISGGEAYDVLSQLPKRLQVAWLDA